MAYYGGPSGGSYATDGRFVPAGSTFVPSGPAVPPTAPRTGTGDAADTACMSMCFEPTGAETAEDWEYTGPNLGSYEKVETYQYVGPGRGSVEKVANTTYTGWRCRQVCILLLGLVMVGLIAFLLWLLLRNQSVGYEEPSVEVTSVPFDCEAGYSNWQHGWSPMKQNYCCSTVSRGCHAAAQACVLWGDPHIRTFDKSRLVFYSEGDFWLVKSPAVHIQGRFQATDWTRKNDKTDYSSMTSIIVGGSFLSHKIEVQSMLGKIYCDGEEILQQFGDTYCGGGHIVYNSQGALVDQAMAFLPHKVVHIYMGKVGIQVNRWPNFINAKIVMSKQEGQDGVCGNFNGVSSDDMGKALHSRFGHGVPQDELMFAHAIPLMIPKEMPSQKRCGGERRKRAEAICHKESTEAGWSFAECLGDVCDAHTAHQISFQAQEMKSFFSHQ